MGISVDHPPLLARVPDGRRAPVPLPPSHAFLFLALLVGIVPTALAAALVGLLVRRARLVLAAIGLGLLGFLAPVAVVLAASALSDADGRFRVGYFVTQLAAVVLGWALHRAAHPVVRGHALLDGKLLPLGPLVLAGFAATMLLPFSIRVALVVPALTLLFSGLP